MTRRALFVASAVSYFREMAPVVWHFAEQGWQVQVLLGSSGAISDDVVDHCRARGIRAETAPPEVGYGQTLEAAASSSVTPMSHAPRGLGADWQSRWWSSVRGALRATRLGRFRPIPGEWRRMRNIRRYADGFIARAKPDVVFQGAYHSVGQIDNGIARACRHRGIPRYCLPNSGYVGGRIMPVGRSSHLRTGMASAGILADYDWVNRVFARLFPAWTCRLSDGRRAFYWDPVVVFTAWVGGLFFDRLWLKPAVDFDRVFVFSEYSAGLLRDDAYPMEKVVVSGQPLLDPVWQRSRDPDGQAEIFAHLRIDAGTPFFLVNIEPSAEHLYCDWDRHLDNVHAVMNAVSGHGLPVVLSLHPLCDAPRYDFAEQQYGARICRDFKIHDLYPLCAISISFPCSTNLLAAVFQKPLIIYDFFGQTNADPDSAFVHALPGASIATSGTELAAIVGSIAADLPGRIDVVAPTRSACTTILDAVASDLATGVRADALAGPPIAQPLGSHRAQGL